jgi:cytochrome P450
MLLQAFPETLKRLREEHDTVFHKDQEKTVALLRENPGLLKDLNYTTAVIQETLRMFPVGLIIRAPLPHMYALLAHQTPPRRSFPG